VHGGQALLVDSLTGLAAAGLRGHRCRRRQPHGRCPYRQRLSRRADV